MLSHACIAQFKDKAREKQRQRLLTQRALERAEEAAAQLQSGHAGAHAGPARGKKEEKPVQERRLPAAKRRALGATQDEEDFADDYRALKKVKKGRISEVSGAIYCACIAYSSVQVNVGWPCMLAASLLRAGRAATHVHSKGGGCLCNRARYMHAREAV